MSIDVRIVGPGGDAVVVNRLGSMAVSPVSFNEVVFIELAEPDTGFTFYEPRSGQQFVITNVFALGDREITGMANATVEVMNLWQKIRPR